MPKVNPWRFVVVTESGSTYAFSGHGCVTSRPVEGSGSTVDAVSFMVSPTVGQEMRFLGEGYPSPKTIVTSPVKAIYAFDEIGNVFTTQRLSIGDYGLSPVLNKMREAAPTLV